MWLDDTNTVSSLCLPIRIFCSPPYHGRASEPGDHPSETWATLLEDTPAFQILTVTLFFSSQSLGSHHVAGEEKFKLIKVCEVLAHASLGVLVERYFTTCSLITCRYEEVRTLNTAGCDAPRHIREWRRTPTWTLQSFKWRSRKTQNCRFMKLCYDNAALAILRTPLSLTQPLRTWLTKKLQIEEKLRQAPVLVLFFFHCSFAHSFTQPTANQRDFYHAHFGIGCSQKSELNWKRKLLEFFLGLILNVTIFYQWTIWNGELHSSGLSVCVCSLDYFL